MEQRAGVTIRRVALKIQYDGLNFHGWQIQNSGRTVQGEIENALLVMTGKKISITASGRTDAGVHALGQIAHCDLSINIPLEKICRCLNGIMPKDVSIVNAYEVSADFHARYSACEREYLYLIYNHKYCSPFIQNRALWVKRILDIDYLKEACSYLVGKHDFESFCKKISSNDNTVRIINNINISKKDEMIYFNIKGTAFLHNMIRIIIGTLIDMSKNNRKPEYMQEILNHKDRNMSGKTSAAHGLYLKQIYYSPDLEKMNSALNIKSI